VAWFDALLRAYGPQRWWPAESPFEVMVGAILTQNTAWTNVEKTIASLRRRGWLDPHAIDALPASRLGPAIRSSGTWRLKARRLKTLVRWFVSRGADVALLRDLPDLRDELLALDGVGPETADAILLYAVGRPNFVIDAYTRRVLSRHGLAPSDATYDELQRLFESTLPRDAALFNEFHALIVRAGKRHCRATALCAGCPLERFLPKRKPPDGRSGGFR
jgi:endonuclease-3 related protein